MLGDFLQHQAEHPRFQSDLQFLKVQYACWDLELDYRWLRNVDEASVRREGSFKLLVYIKKQGRTL